MQKTPERLRGPMILACSFERVARARPAKGQITREQERERANAWIEGLQSANGGWGACPYRKLYPTSAKSRIGRCSGS